MWDDGRVSQEKNSEVDVRYGKRLRELREQEGMTQAELVQRIRGHGHDYMNTSTLSRVESGTRPVRLSEAQSIAAIFGVSINSMTLGDALVASYNRALREASEERASVLVHAENFTEAQQDLQLERAALLSDGDPETEAGVKAIDGQFHMILETDLVAEVRKIVDEKRASSLEGTLAEVENLARGPQPGDEIMIPAGKRIKSEKKSKVE